MIRKLLFVAPLLALVACSSPYRAMVVDGKSGLYTTPVKVDPASVLSFDTSVDPRRFPYVLLTTESNVRADGFDFQIRQALAQAGMTRVYSTDEFRLLARDKGFALERGWIPVETLQKFSSQVGPVLIVHMSRVLEDGFAQEHVVLRTSDGVTGKPLLQIDQRKSSGTDTETLFPVLNKLRQWVRESSKENA